VQTRRSELLALCQIEFGSKQLDLVSLLSLDISTYFSSSLHPVATRPSGLTESLNRERERNWSQSESGRESQCPLIDDEKNKRKEKD